MGKFAPWVGYLIALLGLPQLFDSVLAITIFNQMAIAIVFALSYNMLLGQGGMLSFGHAVYFGLGGFMAVHALIMIEFETVYFSITLIPLVGGLIGLIAAIFVGSFSTYKAGTVFAMISLGIGELVAASSLIFDSFFGGEAGVSADRTFGPPFFGIEFFQDVEIYYLSAGWVFASTVFTYLFTQTPAGRQRCRGVFDGTATNFLRCRSGSRTPAVVDDGNRFHQSVHACPTRGVSGSARGIRSAAAGTLCVHRFFSAILARRARSRQGFGSLSRILNQPLHCRCRGGYR